MLKKLLEIALANRGTVVLAVAGTLALALMVALNLPVDAVPDITNVQVIVNAKTGGLDPQQVEKSVTYFVETEMAGLPAVKEVRSLSRFGLSQTVVIFHDDTNIYWARQQIAEKIIKASASVPAGVVLEMAPITTGLGEVFMYAVVPKPGSALAKKSEKERLVYLRTIQHFVIRPYLKSNIAGVAEVDSLGGYERQVHIESYPLKMEQYGVTFNQISETLKSLGDNYGGGYIEKNKQQFIVSTYAGLNLDQIQELPLRMNWTGSPIRLKQVARIGAYHAQRIGAATYNGEETVLGTVLMLSGQNSREVALQAEEALKHAPLPEDVETQVLYSRSFLVNATVKTIVKNLAEGAGIVVLILFLFLGNMRAAFFVALAIPVSMAVALIGMKVFGISANLMSLGALDFGLIVDGSIVMMENLLTRIEHHQPKTLGERIAQAKEATLQIMGPMTTGMIIIMAVYLPILTLEGIEGKLYYPMAITVLFALGGALVVAVLVMPVFGIYLAPKFKPHKTRFITALYAIYEPILNFPLRHAKRFIVPIILVFAICGWLFTRLGADFMPPLNEGDMTLNLLHDARISLTESIDRERKAEKIIAAYPEVARVFGRIGTSEAATDPMGVNLTDLFVILKKDQTSWRKNDRGKTLTPDELFALVQKDLEPVLAKTAALAESELAQTQPIAMRFNEILEGSRADVSLRIYGRDLDTLFSLQEKAVAIMESIPGARAVSLDALTALRRSAVVHLKLKYDKINYYGLSVADVNEGFQAAMVGKTIGSYYEKDWRFAIVVKIDDESRRDVALIKRLPIALPAGGTIALGELADFEERTTITSISRSGMNRYAGIAIYLGDRDTLSFVQEAQARIKTDLGLPADFRLQWGGQFKNLERARLRLLVVVPLILAVIFYLVWRTFGSIRQTVLIFLTIPFAWTGGVLSLYFAKMTFSVSAAIGFIALSGLAVLNGLVKIKYLNDLVAEGHSVAEAVKLGALGRLRPVLMTALVASFGFLPMVLNTGIGAEVQRPLALVVLGGLVSATLMTLLFLPSFYKLLEEKK
jgi:cobalt-zinc-cadmium resistance protein CzcA